ncbi:MAG: hypothetical protein AAF357_09940 [Verrucomicrobiota bacterium]
MKVLRFLVPRISPADLGRMVVVTIAGAFVAGAYGILHDQVTYSISPEYFSRFKFQQFAYAEPPGGHPRVFAGIIGFLATWWVGAFFAWAMARVALMRNEGLPPYREFAVAFLITFSISFLIACGGFGYGLWRKARSYAVGWTEWMDAMAVQDTESFMTVGYIHNSSYLGGVVGTLVAILYLRAARKRQNLGPVLADSAESS